MAKAGTVRPSTRAKGKFEAVYADGKAHPYAFRTEAEARAVLPEAVEKPKPPAAAPPETKTE